MRNFKKVVAGLLAVLMLALSVNVSFAAEEYSDKEAIVVAKVSGTGIMTGTDKGFEPSKSLTRAEAAAIIVRMKGISESAVKASAGTTLFTDVAAAHWASGYINQASNLGIVKGVSATLFAPDREVTVAEFVTMAARALGAGTMIDAEGTWPTNYVNFANEEGLLDDVSAVYSAVSTRMNAATIVANALTANMWAKTAATTKSEITYTEQDKTILEDVLGYDYMNAAVVKKVDTKNRNLTLDEYLAAKHVDEYSKIADISTYEAKENVNLASVKVGDEIDVWFSISDKEVVAVMPAKNSKQTKVEFTEIVKASDANKVTLKVDGAEKKYDIKAGATITYNEETEAAFEEDDVLDTLLTGYNANSKNGNVFGSATIVSGDITALYLEEYTDFAVVKTIKNDKVTAYEKATDVIGTNATYKFNFDEDADVEEYAITKDGKEVKELEEGDAIAFYGNDTTPADVKKYIVKVLTDTVEGKVTSVSSSYIKVDGTKYDLRKGFTATGISAGDEVTAYLLNGKICLVEITEETDDSEFAVVTSYRERAKDYDTDSTKVYEVVLTGFDGVKTDVMQVNLTKTFEKLAKDNAWKDATFDETSSGLNVKLNSDDDQTDTAVKVSDITKNKDVVAATLMSNTILGTVVRYEISNGKVVFTELAGKSNGSAEIATSTLAINKDANKIGDLRINDDVKIFVLDKGDEDYEKTIKEVKFEDLKNSESYSVTYADLDDSVMVASYILLPSTTKRTTTDKNFGIVKSIGSSLNDDEIEIELITAEGTISLTAEDKRVDELVAGTFIKYDSGDVISNIEILGDADSNISTDNFALISDNGDTLRVLDDSDAKVVYDVDENVIYATCDSIAASPLTGLKKVETTPVTFDIDTYTTYATAISSTGGKADACKAYFIRDTKTNVLRIVAVIRNK